MKTVENINKIMDIYEKNTFKDVEGVELNKYEVSILEEKLLSMIDDCNFYYGGYNENIEELKYFIQDIKNIEIPQVIDNTNYNIDNEEVEYLMEDGYIVVNDYRYFYANEFIDYDTDMIKTVDLSDIIDYDTMKKYIDLYYNDEKCEYDCCCVLFKIMKEKEKYDFNTLSVLLKHTRIIGDLYVKTLHGNYVKY